MSPRIVCTTKKDEVARFYEETEIELRVFDHCIYTSLQGDNGFMSDKIPSHTLMKIGSIPSIPLGRGIDSLGIGWKWVWIYLQLARHLMIILEVC